MKKICVIFTLLISVLTSFAESVKPTYGVVTERHIEKAIIEGKIYYDISIELNAAELNDIFVSGVKVIVKNSDGKKIYNKRFSKSFLYGFSDGSLQVGKGNALTQVVIQKSYNTGKWLAEVREKGIE